MQEYSGMPRELEVTDRQHFFPTSGLYTTSLPRPYDLGCNSFCIFCELSSCLSLLRRKSSATSGAMSVKLQRTFPETNLYSRRSIPLPGAMLIQGRPVDSVGPWIGPSDRSNPSSTTERVMTSLVQPGTARIKYGRKRLGG